MFVGSGKLKCRSTDSTSNIKSSLFRPIANNLYALCRTCGRKIGNPEIRRSKMELQVLTQQFLSLIDVLVLCSHFIAPKFSNKRNHKLGNRSSNDLSIKI
eukprot:Colp12_sorted_trinity150504_noHs@36570